VLNDDVSSLHCVAFSDGVIRSNELERMWKEMVIAGFEALPQYFLEPIEENHTLTLACLQAKI
jgi:hypothetical protein